MGGRWSEPASTHLRRSVDEMFTARGASAPTETIQCGSLAASARLAAAGLGLAAVPLQAAQPEIDAGRLRVVDARPALPPTHVALMYRKVSAIYLDTIRLLDEAVGR
ncbi:MAG: LysR substrate-binding domain-containing protein [Ramlibacter sp.]